MAETSPLAQTDPGIELNSEEVAASPQTFEQTSDNPILTEEITCFDLHDAIDACAEIQLT